MIFFKYFICIYELLSVPFVLKYHSFNKTAYWLYWIYSLSGYKLQRTSSILCRCFLENRHPDPPPEQLSKQRVQKREDEVHDEEAVQFLTHKRLPALRRRQQEPCVMLVHSLWRWAAGTTDPHWRTNQQRSAFPFCVCLSAYVCVRRRPFILLVRVGTLSQALKDDHGSSARFHHCCSSITISLPQKPLRCSLLRPHWGLWAAPWSELLFLCSCSSSANLNVVSRGWGSLVGVCVLCLYAVCVVVWNENYHEVNVAGIGCHPTQPVITEDSEHTHFQHQVSTDDKRKLQSCPLPLHVRQPCCSHTVLEPRMCAQTESGTPPSRRPGWRGSAAAGWGGTPEQAEPAGWLPSVRGLCLSDGTFAADPAERKNKTKTPDNRLSYSSTVRRTESVQFDMTKRNLTKNLHWWWDSIFYCFMA